MKLINWWIFTRWFDKWWYKYLLASRNYPDISWRKVILCRLKGHPNGIVYYNPNGYEPDDHCVDCGDRLG